MQQRENRHLESVKLPLTGRGFDFAFDGFTKSKRPAMRDDYLKDAQKVIPDSNLLINVISRRVKQLRRGSRALVESLEKLSPEDIALREVIEGKISFEISESN